MLLRPAGEWPVAVFYPFGRSYTTRGTPHAVRPTRYAPRGTPHAVRLWVSAKRFGSTFSQSFEPPLLIVRPARDWGALVAPQDNLLQGLQAQIISSLSSRPVWQGVSTDSLKFHPGQLCPTLLRSTAGPPSSRPHGRF
jgi:hypothetical protein